MSRELPTDLDIVVHCAGDVSFDPPIDQAFTTNVIGTKALLDRMLEAVADEGGSDAGSRITCTSPPRTRPAAGAARSPRRHTCTTSTTTPKRPPALPCGS